jgi:hypothetical protein
LDLALWSQAGTSLLLQFGAIWLPALAAALWWWRARRWFALGLAVVVGGGMAAFHFFEDPQWIGFARFNLLVLPPVLWLAWEGLGRWMARAPRYAALASVVLVILNWLLSPVDLSGGRAAWGNSPERWYDFTACLRDVGQRAPEARVLLGNFEYSYALLQVADRLGWRPPWTGESPPVRGVPPEAALERTLRQAAARGADWVIYRSEEDLELAPGRIIAGYQKQRDYPARAGRLTLFRQVAPPLTP